MKARTKAVLRPPVTRLINHYVPAGRSDIALVSSPRSGSTWLMEVLSSCAGVSYRDEPDHRSMIDSHQLLDPEINTRWSYGSLSEQERTAFVDYLRDDRRVSIFGPTSPLQAGWEWRATRRVLKIIRMTAVIELFTDDLGYDVVYLVRHPIAQAMSSHKRGHVARLDCYLGDARFMAQLPSDAMRAQVAESAASGDPLEMLVVDWCLANRNPLSAGPDAPWFSCSYEQLTVSPSSVVTPLWEHLGLPDPEGALARLAVPSRNADPSHRSVISSADGSRSSLVNGWRRHLTEVEEKRLMDLVALFGIDTYEVGSDGPVRPLPGRTGAVTHP